MRSVKAITYIIVTVAILAVLAAIGYFAYSFVRNGQKSFYLSYGNEKILAGTSEIELPSNTTVFFTGRTIAGVGEKSDQIKVELLCDQSVEHGWQGVYSSNFSFKRIQSVSDFLASEETTNVYKCGVFDVTEKRTLTDEAKAELSDKAWVLRFVETPRVSKTTLNGTGYTSTLIGDVTILRLKFVTDGVTYNLGVVDNKQTGGSDPVNNTETKIGLNSTFSWILLAILFVVLLIVLLPFLPTILSVIVKVIVWIVKAVFWIVALPIRGIAALIRTIKERRENTGRDRNNNDSIRAAASG